MRSIAKHFSFVSLSSIWLISLFNPMYKKYDYGAGFPVLIVLGGLIGLLILVEWKRNRERSRYEELMLLGFSLFVLVSQYFSVAGNIGLSEMLAYLAVVVIYLIYAYKDNRFLDKFLKVVSWGALAACVMGFFIYVVRDEARMIGPFFNQEYHSHVWPNAFALFLLLTWPLCFYVFRNSWARSFVMAVMISSLFLSFSRGASIAFFGQILLLCIYYFRRWSVKGLMGLVISAAMVYGLFIGANHLREQNHRVLSVEEKINFENDEGLTSKQERVDFWLAALELMDDRPITGYGPFTFRYAYGQIQERMLGIADHPHNVFLKIGVENGVVAMSFFVMFLLGWLNVLVRRFGKMEALDLADKRNKQDRVALMFVAVAGALAHNLIDYNFNFLANWLLFFLLLAFIRSEVAKKKLMVRRAPVIAMVLGIVVFGFAVKEGSLRVLNIVFPSGQFYEFFSYPRDYYLAQAEEAIGKKDYGLALELIDRHLDFNELEAQSFYLKGVVYCDEKGELFDQGLCLENMKRALELRPLDSFRYRRDYAYYLQKFGKEEEFELVLNEGRELLETYFYYVENNVHFTAYTDNVEAAGEFVSLFEGNVSRAEWNELVKKREKMFDDSEYARQNRTF